MASSISVLGRQVARRRERLGLSLTQLAKLAGLHPETVRRIERGAGDPKLRSVDLLAKGLKTEPWRLLKPKPKPWPRDQAVDGEMTDFVSADSLVAMIEEALDQALLRVSRDPKLRRRLMRSLVRCLEGLREADWRDLSETERSFLGLLLREEGEVERTAEELASMIGRSTRSFWYAVTALEGSWIKVVHRRGKGKRCIYRLLETRIGELMGPDCPVRPSDKG